VIGLFGTSSVPSEQYLKVCSKLLIIIIIIIIIIFLHGLGRLNCSGIDGLSSFPEASTISSSSRFVVEGVFRKSGVVHSFNVQGCAYLLMSTLIFLGRVISPSAKPPFLEDQFVSLGLASLLLFTYLWFIKRRL